MQRQRAPRANAAQSSVPTRTFSNHDYGSPNTKRAKANRTGHVRKAKRVSVLLALDYADKSCFPFQVVTSPDFWVRASGMPNV